MITTYCYIDGATYFFYFDYERENAIRVVKVENDVETEKIIPVRNSNEYRVKVNKKSISAYAGAAGLFEFITECIESNFMTAYADMIIKAFF